MQETTASHHRRIPASAVIRGDVIVTPENAYEVKSTTIAGPGKVDIIGRHLGTGRTFALLYSAGHDVTVRAARYCADHDLFDCPFAHGRTHR